MELKCGLFVFAVLVGFVQSENLVNKKCPERPILKNFDVSKYSGQWFEIYRYEQHFSSFCQCVHTTYTPVGNKIVSKFCCDRITGPFCVEGSAVLSYPNHKPLEGRLNVTYAGPPEPSNYWILDTDYDHFSVVYHCENIEGDKSKETFWLMSRSKVLPADVKEKAEGLVDKYFDRKSSVFEITRHEDSCNYD